MTIDSSTIYKLMILYMLNKLDSQLTNAQLSGFFIKKKYTDYFNIQQALSELCDSGFVETVKMRNTSYYSITSEGYETLTFFKNRIPAGALEDIDSFLVDNKYDLKNEVGTRSDFYKTDTGEYITTCQVLEGSSLLYELNISVPSEEEAIRICANWKGYSEDIYAFIMKNLLQ